MLPCTQETPRTDDVGSENASISPAWRARRRTKYTRKPPFASVAWWHGVCGARRRAPEPPAEGLERSSTNSCRGKLLLYAPPPHCMQAWCSGSLTQSIVHAGIHIQPDRPLRGPP